MLLTNWDQYDVQPGLSRLGSCHTFLSYLDSVIVQLKLDN